MPDALDLLREGRNKELWKKCCGFLDLSIDEFMDIQKRLLLEQLELLNNCEMGNHIMRGAKPRSVEEFRDQVPITTYSDYIPYLSECMDETLPAAPIIWQRTSGKSGEYPFKSAPITQAMYQDLGDLCLLVLFLSSCRDRHDIIVEEHDKLFYAMAPPPYASGCWAQRTAEENIFQFLPPIEVAETLPFEKRIEHGFKMGLAEGIDIMYALSSVVVAIGEQLGQGGGLKRALALLSTPKVLPRLLMATIKSRIAGRPMLPKDIWSLKGLIAFGADTAVYREKINTMWGMYPLEVYGCTEGVVISIQTWDRDTMTFLPHINFLEFMPEAECSKWEADATYQPQTVLIDNVEAGENYGVVITSFRGGAFIRYFIGDVVKITSLRNEKLNIDIPQMVFDFRTDGIIDIAGFTRLTENTIWKAIERTGIPYVDWAARKESSETPVLHLYIESKNHADTSNDAIAVTIHEQLKTLDSDYADVESILGLRPLEVTLLPKGAFDAYIAEQRNAGADLAHLKPPHMNPKDAVIERLLNPHLANT